MKKKRGIFAGRQQTPPAIPPTQISDAKLLADLDVEIAAAERAANPPEGSTAVINALSPGLAAMMPTATKQARKKLLTLLNRCKIPRYRFAWDDPSVDLTDQFARVGDALRTKSRSAKMVYVLANFGSSTPDDVLFRIYILRSLNYDPYVMIYDKPNAQQIYLDLQRWCNNKMIFGAVECFDDYCAGKGVQDE